MRNLFIFGGSELWEVGRRGAGACQVGGVIQSFCERRNARKVFVVLSFKNLFYFLNFIPFLCFLCFCFFVLFDFHFFFQLLCWVGVIFRRMCFCLFIYLFIYNDKEARSLCALFHWVIVFI